MGEVGIFHAHEYTRKRPTASVYIRISLRINQYPHVSRVYRFNCKLGRCTWLVCSTLEVVYNRSISLNSSTTNIYCQHQQIDVAELVSSDAWVQPTLCRIGWGKYYRGETTDWSFGLPWGEWEAVNHLSVGLSKQVMSLPSPLWRKYPSSMFQEKLTLSDGMGIM